MSVWQRSQTLGDYKVKKKSIEISSVKTHVLQMPHQLQSQCYVFATDDGTPGTALVFGSINDIEKPLVRVHSRCMYGEVFKSLDCDCHAQLERALELITKESGGVFFYLEQEGRGHGLINKANAYLLKEQEDLDTVEAYLSLGLEIDIRSYEGVAGFLRYMKISSIRLLTNNPLKISALQNEGLSVERVPLRTKPTKENASYLRVKQEKLDHDLDLNSEGLNTIRGKSDTKIVVIGGAVMDFVWQVDTLSGRATQARSFRSWPGGKGLNQAIAIARQGVRASMISAVGTDSAGVRVLECLEENGVACDFVEKIEAGQTAVTNVVIDDRGEPSFIGFNSVVQDNVDESLILRAKDEISEAQAILLTLEVSLGVIADAIDLAHEYKKTIILSASPPLEAPHTFPTSLLGYLDALILDSRDASLTFPSVEPLSPRECATYLHKNGAKLVCVMSDDQGCIVASIEGVREFPHRSSEPVDKTGAGDAFSATLAIALCNNDPLEAAINKAIAARSLAMAKLGGSPSMPFGQDIDESLELDGSYR